MKAWQLLERKGWCKGAAARDGRGRPTSIHSPHAVRFCLVGALLRCYYRDGEGLSMGWVSLREAIGDDFGKWNDRKQSGKPVVALLKRLDL